MIRPILPVLLVCFSAAQAQQLDADSAAEALRKATEFFRTHVSASGGYLWRYSSDLKYREGEGRASATSAWVQPPGTPSVGMAYLEAFQLTGDKYYLEAAIETGMALVLGQLESGGWDYRIEFSGEDRARYNYRTAQRPEGRNTSTLDDNTTQSALRFLMSLDNALGGANEEIRDAVVYGLESLVRVQYPNGAWPQRFSGPPDPAKHPVKKASYPAKWSRSYPAKHYRNYYTFNDNTIADTIDTLFLAGEIYRQAKYREAAIRAGEFILLAQMPEPQPGWAQQYDADMHPAWARKFEPPAITGGEARGIIQTLIKVYQRTGEKRFLEPIPKALDYYKKSVMPNGKLARFYELRTNKPLFFTKDYRLTYSDEDLPTHYGFQIGDWTKRLSKALERADRIPNNETGRKPRLTNSLRSATRGLIERMDKRGAWLREGTMRFHRDAPVAQVIESDEFATNIRMLARYVAASRQ